MRAIRWEGHGFRRDFRINVMAGDECVDHIEVADTYAVHHVDAARTQCQSRL
jgi:hypothetical protein